MPTSTMPHRIGLISDTHKLVRPQALDFLAGSDLIVHAGDMVTPEVLDALRAIAPVLAVRGNNDQGDWARNLPEVARANFEGIELLVVHDLATLAVDPVAEGVRIVVSGHSHKPAVTQRGGVWYVNPGSAGPRRFSLPVSVGEVLIGAQGVEVRTVNLAV